MGSMTTLQYYAFVNNYLIAEQHYISPSPSKLKIVPVSTVTQITLSNYLPDTSDFLIAFNIADYRKNLFQLALLTEIHIPVDDILGKETKPLDFFS